jgi:hypothetical protein
MRLTLTFFMLCALATMSFAQINSASPFPVDFEILSPAGAVGIYDYGTQAGVNTDFPWGPTLSETLVAEVAWGYNAAGDSLGCEAIVTDLTGKIAIIRRGTCDFTTKVQNAQDAGALGVIILNHFANAGDTDAFVIGMSCGAVENCENITIPAIFVSRSTGTIIADALAADEAMSVSFTVKSFYDPTSSFSIQTPVTDAIEFDSYFIHYVNPNSVDAADVTVTATITAPSGAETVLTGTSFVEPLADSIIVLDGGYTPTELGEYAVTWTHDQGPEQLTSNFYTTDYTYGTADPSLGQAPRSADADFSAGNFIYQAGALSIIDTDGAVTTHASFGLSNGADLFTGDVNADQIVVILYDADADADGLIDFSPTSQATTTFDELLPVALASYTITGNETIDQQLFVEWEDLADGDNMVALKPDGAYYTVIAYDGTEAGLGICPGFAASSGVSYLNFPTTPIIVNGSFFSGGWNGATVGVNLHLAGFEPPVGTEDLPGLDASKVTLAPNPVSSRLNVMFDLDQTADKVQMIMTDVSGKIITTEQYEQVLNQSIEIDMERLPRGSYFLSIATPEGYRVERIIKQ